MSRKALILSAALLAMAPSFVCAGVLGKSETSTATAVLADVDLSTTAGIAQARKRLVLVAERLCRKFRDDREAGDWATYVDCVHDTVASTLRRIQTPVSSLARN
jgi:UrcA family protein